jgi:hypothetical protein
MLRQHLGRLAHLAGSPDIAMMLAPTLRPLIAPIVLGLLASISPVEPVCAGSLAIAVAMVLEWRRTRKQGFLPLGPLRFLAMASFIAAAHFAPTKYADRMVDTINAEFIEEPAGVVLVTNDNLQFHFPPGISIEQLGLPRIPLPLRELMARIERNTGLTGHLGYCGVGASILWGAYPMGGPRFTAGSTATRKCAPIFHVE